MKKILIPMIALAVAATAPTQIKQFWSNKLSDPMNEYRAGDIAVAHDGITYTLSQFAGTLCRVSAYDGFGNRLWVSQLPVLSSTSLTIECDPSGNPVVLAPDANYTVHVIKLNRSNGSTDWHAPIQQAAGGADLKVDSAGNVIIAYVSMSDFKTNVRKYSPAGAPLFTTSGGESFQTPRSLVVAANGQIYVGTTDHRSVNSILALTPNGTVRYSRSWLNASGMWPSTYPVPSYVLTDRNGRAFAVEQDGGDFKKIQVRTFASDGSVIEQLFSADEPALSLRAAIDADSRLVIASSRSSALGTSVAVDWLSTSASGATHLTTSRAVTTGPQPYVFGVLCDAFGQAYVHGLTSNGGDRGMLWAFDPSKPTDIWSMSDPNGTAVSDYTYAAVGRWGQVSMSNTLDTNKLADSHFSVKQLGFRNMLINGSAHTGGRTITGTANFYSSDTGNRNVALASNTPYATVALTTSVAQGQSQGTFSVDLKPTAVRRAVRIDGTYNGTTRSVVFYLEPPVVSSLTLYPTTVKGGANVNATARINGDAPTGGINVVLSSNKPSATVPGAVIIPEGDITKGFIVSTKVVSQTTTATLSATANNVTKTATLTVTP